VRFSVRHVVPPILQLPHSRTTQAFIAVDAASQPSVYGPLLAVFTTFCDTMDYCKSPLCVCVRVHLSNYDLAQRFTIANILRLQSWFSYCKNLVDHIVDHFEELISCRCLHKSSAVAEMSHRARAKCTKKWGCCAPFRVGAGSPSNTMSPGPMPYLRTKWHLDPSNRLATIHQRYRHANRQDSQDNGPIA